MLAMPALCWLCRMPLRIARHGICSLCLRGLPPLPLLCPRCGLPAGSAKVACGRCQLKPPAWQALVCVNDYCPPFSQWVNQLKFSHITALRVMLARLLLLSWLNVYRRGSVPRPDLLLPVPLHRRRRWQRGFNQTVLLAAPLAHWLGCEWREGLSRKRGAHYSISSAPASAAPTYGVLSALKWWCRDAISLCWMTSLPPAVR